MRNVATRFNKLLKAQESRDSKKRFFGWVIRNLDFRDFGAAFEHL